MSIAAYRMFRVLSAAVFAAATALPASAQEVVLRGKETALNITGTLISSEGGRFVVQTAIGEFEIEQSLVTCEGEACPVVEVIEYDFSFAADSYIAESLLVTLAEGFAASLDAEALRLDASGNTVEDEQGPEDYTQEGAFSIQVADFDGDVIANFGIFPEDDIEAYEMMASGEVSIIFADERAPREFRDVIEAGGAGDLNAFEQNRVIAVDGLAVIVNPQNNVGGVTVKQLADIFAGNITDWSELGGNPGPINLYSYAAEDDDFLSVYELILEPYEYTLSSEANIVRNASELATAIGSDTQGFGVIEYTARRDTRALPITNECGMTFFISLFNIKTEEYPLSRRNLLYNHANLEGYARDFIDYLDGPDLDGLIAKAGFVNLDVVSEVQVEAAERVSAALPSADSYERRFMETLIQKQNEFERLSTTFRFAPGSDDLDPKGIRDLDRLVRFLAERKPSELIVVGFSDDRGTFDANILVSEEIASSVLGQIKAAAAGGELDGIVMSSLGFGELSPVACNKTPRGRAVNRRVEIWIK